EGFPSLPAGQWFEGRCHIRALFVSIPWLNPVGRRLPGRDFGRAEFFRTPGSSHRRNPPRNALALSPARQPEGSSLSFLALPPPSTTSSGSMAATNRSTTSAT